MIQPPTVSEEQTRKDSEHPKLLSIFHFIAAGLSLLGLCFILLHYLVMSHITSHPDLWNQQRSPFPEGLFEILVWFYVFLGLAFIASCALNILSGFFLRQRKHRTFSLIVGALNCLHFPLGTALGGFTIIVLLRESVCKIYAETEA